ncbi:MAG: tetratricopeptide repeat protein, partial [Candidatus Promineifilaceae bacterium]
KQQGLAYFNNGEYGRALTSFESAAQAYEAAEDSAGRAEMINNIGVIHLRQHNYEAAIAALNDAQSAFAAVGDTDRQAQALGNLGDLYAAQHNYQDAGKAYSNAAQLFAGIGESRRQADVLRAYSLMALRRREILTAMNLMAESLRVRPKRSIGQQLFLLLLRIVLRLMAGG